MKTDISKSTPRPWSYREDTDDKNGQSLYTINNPSEFRGAIADLCGRGERLPFAEANAALIVTAVNQFDAFEELLNKAVHLRDRYAALDKRLVGNQHNELNGTITAFDAALTKLQAIRNKTQ